jgi:hypothetical protein
MFLLFQSSMSSLLFSIIQDGHICGCRVWQTFLILLVSSPLFMITFSYHSTASLKCIKCQKHCKHLQSWWDCQWSGVFMVIIIMIVTCEWRQSWNGTENANGLLTESARGGRGLVWLQFMHRTSSFWAAATRGLTLNETRSDTLTNTRHGTPQNYTAQRDVPYKTYRLTAYSKTYNLSTKTVIFRIKTVDWLCDYVQKHSTVPQ